MAKNLEEVVDLVIALYKSGKGAMADGKVGVEDLAYLMAVLPKVAPALADIDEVPSELAALSEEEAAAVVAKVAGELSVDSVKAGIVAQNALKIIYHAYLMVKELRA